MRRGTTALTMATAVAALSFGTSVIGQVVWTENFDSYSAGSGLSGQGGWTTWDGDPAWDSTVTDAMSRSSGNSLDVSGDSDSVYMFSDQRPIDCGQWRVTAYVYTPSDMNAPNDNYFLLLNTYEHGGPYHWSTSVHFSTGTGTVFADWDNEALPLTTDAWVEVRVEIDLDNDWQQFYYGGDLLYEDVWADRIGTDGKLALEAMDLFAYGATSQFWDDISLEQTGDCPEPICLELEVDRLIAGAKSTFTITDANGSNSVVALVYGTEAGTTNVNGYAGYCASFGIKGVNQNRLICQGKLDNGTKACGQTIPGGFVGVDVLFQAAMRDTCDDQCMSEVLAGTIQ